MSRETNDLYEFGHFCLNAPARTLFHDNAHVPLKPKVVDTLIALLEDAGNVVSKSQLMEKVWSESFVEESNLSVNIYELRKAFKNFDNCDDLIQTVPRRGFRFNAEVVRKQILHENGKIQYAPAELGEERRGADRIEEKASMQADTRKTFIYALCALGFLLLGSGIWVYHQNGRADVVNPPQRTAWSDRSKVENRQTENLESYQLYRRGLELWRNRNSDDMLQGAELYRRSIALDPNFILPYIGLADTYSMLHNDPAEWKMADDYVKKALAIDPDSAEAHASLAFIEAMDKWQWQEAENEYKRAIALDPNCGKAHQWYATLLMVERRFDDAEVELRKAIEIEPMSPNYNSDLCEFDTYAKPFGEIKAQCLRSQEIAPHANNLMILEQAFIVESIRGNKIDAAEADAVMPKTQIPIYLAGGARAVETRVLQESLKYSHEKILHDYNLSLIYATLGEKEKSYEYLDKSFEAHAFLLPFVNARREFDLMRGDPHFKNLMNRIGLIN